MRWFVHTAKVDCTLNAPGWRQFWGDITLGTSPTTLITEWDITLGESVTKSYPILTLVNIINLGYSAERLTFLCLSPRAYLIYQ